MGRCSGATGLRNGRLLLDDDDGDDGTATYPLGRRAIFRCSPLFIAGPAASRTEVQCVLHAEFTDDHHATAKWRSLEIDGFEGCKFGERKSSHCMHDLTFFFKVACATTAAATRPCSATW